MAAQLPSLTGNFACSWQLLASHHLLLARLLPNKIPPCRDRVSAVTSSTLNYGTIIQDGGKP